VFLDSDLAADATDTTAEPPLNAACAEQCLPVDAPCQIAEQSLVAGVDAAIDRPPKKRAIIVGNSPDVLKSSWGIAIDQFDSVIRINNFQIGKFAPFVGQRTDHAFISFACHKNREFHKLHPKHIHLFVGPHHDNLDFVKRRMNDRRNNGVELDPEQIDVLAHQTYFVDLKRQLALGANQWPSTGMVAIWWAVHNLAATHEIYLHGFSFFRESKEKLEHYFPWSPQRDSHHDFDAERRLVSRLLAGGTLHTLDPRDDVRRPVEPKRYYIVSHHAEDRDVAVCASAYHAFLSSKAPLGEKSEYLFARDAGRMQRAGLTIPARGDAKVVFNGGFSLANNHALGLLDQCCQSHVPVAIYWHETAWGLRRLSTSQRMSWNLLQSLAAAPNVEHWVVSRAAKQLIAFAFRVPLERIKVVGECIDVESYGQAQRGTKSRYQVVGGGCVNHRKGVDYFVKLSELLRAGRRNEYQCTWYGGGRPNGRAYVPPSERLLHRWAGVHHDVHFPGYVDNLAGRLADADLFLLTSRDDPQPIIALEALASDLPVFCFDSVGTAELLPPEFVACSPRQMVERIERYLNHVDDYPAGFFRKIALQHTPQRFVERIAGDESLIEQPLGSGEYAVALPAHLERTRDIELLRTTLRRSLSELDRWVQRQMGFERSLAFRTLRRGFEAAKRTSRLVRKCKKKLTGR